MISVLLHLASTTSFFNDTLFLCIRSCSMNFKFIIWVVFYTRRQCRLPVFCERFPTRFQYMLSLQSAAGIYVFSMTSQTQAVSIVHFACTRSHGAIVACVLVCGAFSKSSTNTAFAMQCDAGPFYWVNWDA